MQWIPIITEYECCLDDALIRIQRRSSGSSWYVSSITICYTDVDVDVELRGDLEQTKQLALDAYNWAKAKYPKEYFENDKNILITYTKG